MHLIYSTIPSHKEALNISNILVKEQLVACVNILDGMTSVYMWEGVVRQDSEVVIIAKTTSDATKHVIKRIKKLHTYDKPSIFSINTQECEEDFLKWLELSVKLPY